MILHDLNVSPIDEREAALRKALRASLGPCHEWEQAVGFRGEFSSENQRWLLVVTVSLGSLWITYLGMSAS